MGLLLHRLRGRHGEDKAWGSVDPRSVLGICQLCPPHSCTRSCSVHKTMPSDAKHSINWDHGWHWITLQDLLCPENPNKQFKRQPAEQRDWGLYVFPEPPCVGAAICCADDVAMQVGKLATRAVVIAPRGLEITYFHLRSWTSSINARAWHRSSKWSNQGHRFQWDKPKAGDNKCMHKWILVYSHSIVYSV